MRYGSDIRVSATMSTSSAGVTRSRDSMTTMIFEVEVVVGPRLGQPQSGRDWPPQIACRGNEMSATLALGTLPG